MGQYYFIVNLTKQEFISPSDMGDGIKLMEFGCTGVGAMTALALLCADGNGNGMGDIYRIVSGKTRIRKCEKDFFEFERDGKLRRIIVPEVAERWKGDNIVIAGDYAEPGSLLTQRQRLKFRSEVLACYHGHLESLNPETDAREYKQYKGMIQRVRSKGVNIHEVCRNDLFKNITQEAYEGICCDDYVRADLIDDFAKYDHHDCPPFLRREMLKRRKHLKETAPIKGKFISEWNDGIIVSTKATLDPRTGHVNTEAAEIEGLESLIRQYFEPDGDVFIEYAICPECQEYILKAVVNDTDGTNLEDGMECSNRFCDSLQDA